MVVTYQELTTPDCAIATQTSAVERNPQNMAAIQRPPIFCEARSYMRVMMLDLDNGPATCH